jgi:hypothetical protein
MRTCTTWLRPIKASRRPVQDALNNSRVPCKKGKPKSNSHDSSRQRASTALTRAFEEFERAFKKIARPADCHLSAFATGAAAGDTTDRVIYDRHQRRFLLRLPTAPA